MTKRERETGTVFTTNKIPPSTKKRKLQVLAPKEESIVVKRMRARAHANCVSTQSKNKLLKGNSSFIFFLKNDADDDTKTTVTFECCFPALDTLSQKNSATI